MCDLICCFLNRMVIFVVCVGWVRMGLFTCHPMFICCYYEGAKLIPGHKASPSAHRGCSAHWESPVCCSLCASPASQNPGQILLESTETLLWTWSWVKSLAALGERSTARSAGSDTQAASTSACEVDGNSRPQLPHKRSE